jgi:hypothetical protein
LAAMQHLPHLTLSLTLRTCLKLLLMCNNTCMTLLTPLPRRWTCQSLPMKCHFRLTVCRGCARAKPATRLRRAFSTSYSNMAAAQPRICCCSTAS